MMAWTKEQELAIREYGKNIIVSAGAGSGKTAVLSERVLTHIKRGIHIDELLVLTFTNAASLEMKERIRKKLLANNFKEEADKIDISYITTFDALSLSILKKYSYILNLSSNISIIDNSIILLKKKEILTSIFDKLYENKNEKFLKLINDFCLKDDKEIFESILSLDKSLDNLFDKESYLSSYINNYYNDNNINKFIDEYNQLLLGKISQIKELLDFIKSYMDDKNYAKYANYLSNVINSKTYLDIKFNVNNLETIRLMNLEEEAKEIKDNIKKILDELKELTKYNDINEIKESIYLTKDYVDIICYILLEFNKKVNNYKLSVLSFEFSDIAKMAIKIVKENDFIKEELKNKYKEILIDEYHDTNDLQDMFISLIKNNNEYLVGDIKQSIYRFRNANPNLFKLKYNLFNDNINDLKIDLNKNFRSRSNVLDNINLIFNIIMDEDIGGANYLASHQMIFGQENYLNVNDENYNMEFLNYQIDDKEKRYSKEEIEIFTIAKDIKEKVNNKFQIMDKDTFTKRDITYNDFAILIDRSKSFNLFKKIFEYLNIPITIMKDSTITNSIDLDIIKNIYNLLISIKNSNYDTNFKYSFVSIARSFLFELSDNEILKILTQKSYYKTEIYNICKNIVNNIDSLNNKEIYELIIDKFDIVNKLNKVGDIKNHIITLDYIKDIIVKLDDLGYTYIDLYNYLENIIDNKLDINLSLNKSNSNSVKIMTIHTSKGLEFPITYFPLLYEKFNIRDLNNKFCYIDKYGIISLYNKSNILSNTILKVLLKNKYLKDEVSEKLRLFYVGLTRAREKMIFVGSFMEDIMAYKNNGIINNNTRINYRSFNDIINSVYKYIKSYIYNVDIEKINLTKAYNFKHDLNMNLSKGNKILVNEVNVNSNTLEKSKLSKTTNKIITKDEKRNIKLGLDMHYILETTDFTNPNYSNLSNLEKELLEKFINTKIYENAINTYKEVEFMYEEEGILVHGIIDLLLEFEDINFIVDYKLRNVNDESYIKQLEGYKKYIQKTNNKPTLIYLYSIFDGVLTKL